MSFLQALGGLGGGIAAGISDLERMADAKRRKEMYDWQKQVQSRQAQDWANEDEAARRLAAVPTSREGWSGEYASAGNMPTRDDDGNVMPGVSRSARTAGEIARDRAAALSGVGGLKAQDLATKYLDQANAYEDRERRVAREARADADAMASSNEAKGQRALLAAKRALLAGDSAGAVRFLQMASSTLDDGHQFSFDPKTQMMSYGSGDKYLLPPTQYSPEALHKIIDMASDYATPQAYQAAVERRLKERAQADTERRTGIIGEHYTNTDKLGRDVHDARLAGRGGYGHAPQAPRDAQPWFTGTDPKTGEPFVVSGIPGRQDPVRSNLPAGTDLTGVGKARGPSGGGGPKVKYQTSADGTTRIFKGDDVVGVVLPGGEEVPIGWTEEKLTTARSQAKKSGLELQLGRDADGKPALGWRKKGTSDWYSDPDSALKVK